MHDYTLQNEQLVHLLGGSDDFLVNCAQFSAFVYHGLRDLNWAGFYFLRDGVLSLGPFQGKVACTPIALGDGVCGASVASAKSIVVPDVHDFSGHIACDSASRSELVVPLIMKNHILGVFDLDSPLVDRFSEQDREGVTLLVTTLLGVTRFPDSWGQLL